MQQGLWKTLRELLRRYFVAGLLAVAPIGITLWVLAFIVRWLDSLLLPAFIGLLFPRLAEPPDVPPLVGALFTLVMILLAGVIVRHFFGQQVVRIAERLLSRVPVASSIYHGVKQLFEAVFSASTAQGGFSRVVLVEYPRRGMWGLGFVTGALRGGLDDAFAGERMLSCFIPTTPNPTSGFYLIVAESDVREVDLTVEDAFKVIMSAGLVIPDRSPPSQEPLPGLDP